MPACWSLTRATGTINLRGARHGSRTRAGRILPLRVLESPPPHSCKGKLLLHREVDVIKLKFGKKKNTNMVENSLTVPKIPSSTIMSL